MQGVWVAALLGLAVAGDPGAGLSPDEMLRRFFEEEVAAIERRTEEAVQGLREGPERREALRRELRDMLGLEPPPARGPLRPWITGTVDREELGIVVEKLAFQSLPGLWVTANLYRPREFSGKLPAVLYLCGHGRVEIDGVSYGNKVHYQHHPTWFARRGWVCLVIDTLQLGEIEGVHHGTYRESMWWWPSRGYTPAGVEAWNSIRAVDYLETRPEVDTSRIAVTGRSGGGIGSWWLGALDDRVRTVVPVAGITDLRNHILDGCIEGHCDCNYPVNLYRRDFLAVAALCAPKALLHVNTDRDGIFPLDGVMRIHFGLRDLYRDLGEPGRLGLTVAPGPHGDIQELRMPAFRWIERWHRDEPELVEEPATKHFEPSELKVFDELPAEERNTSIHESFVPRAPVPPVPEDRAGFERLRAELLESLHDRTLRNLPSVGGELEVEGFEATGDGLLLRAWTYRSEGAFRLPLWVASSERVREPSVVLLDVVDEEAWRETRAELAPFFPDVFGADGSPPDPRRARRLRRLLDSRDWALAWVAPRGIGPTRWSGDERERKHIRRRFLALGRTLAACRIHDVRRAVRCVLERPGLSEARLWLQSARQMAGVALYAGLLEPRVERLDLRSLPSSHRRGPVLLNVLRVLDLPQAAALVFPRELVLWDVDAEDFAWTARAAELFADEDGASPLAFHRLEGRVPGGR